MPRIVPLFVLMLLSSGLHAAPERYAVQPGDLLNVSVWGDEQLNADCRVLPDGAISMPLVGRVSAAGKTLEELRVQLTERIAEFVPEPEVTVSVLEAAGSQIYVLGNVGKPGAFPITAPLTVTRALALAGGLNAFANMDKIRIIRGEGSAQRLLEVDFRELLKGRDLSSNHELIAGDTLLVP